VSSRNGLAANALETTLMTGSEDPGRQPPRLIRREPDPAAMDRPAVLGSIRGRVEITATS
jgi:hypothetical protein